MINWAN
jgi:hypothetical protein